MSRLKDALDKAAGHDARNDQAPLQGLTGPAPDMAPAGWIFKDSESGPQTDSIPLFEATEEIPPGATDGPPSVDVSPPITDFWKGYQFGEEFRDKVVVASGADVTLVEQYRRLGAVLHHHQLQGGARTVMIASASPGEGKTLTAANLAL